MFDKNFIEANKVFWDRFKEPEVDGLLLVETSGHPVINHSNAVAAKMVAKAKNLRIAWIRYEFTNEQLMKSYSGNSIFSGFKKFSIFFRIRLLLVSAYYYLSRVLFINQLKAFRYKGIPYGDFVYDGYLAVYAMATLHRFDARIIRVFYMVLLRDEEAREILRRPKIKAVLAAHYMGMTTGMLARVAMQQKIPVYWKGGGHEIFNFSVFKDLDQIYDYPLKPSAEEINLLAAECREIIEEDFKKFIEHSATQSYGAFSVAYNNTLHSDVTREKFLQDMGLEDKPIIFVMLHAFNDYPHSHFKSMLFDDYYDWFIQTYHFARRAKTRNWIFKEHPANKFYPTRDVNLKRILRDMPSHVKFISADSQINASVVLKVADAIVTCLGTAGVEMPALRGIPALIAGDTFYDKLGFTMDPGSKKEYFEILTKMKFVPLSPEQQFRARCCYLCLNRYYMMPFAAGPAVKVEELSTNSKELKDAYGGRILKVYREKRELIYSQMDEYINNIKKDDFIKLSKLPTRTLCSNFTFV